MKVFLFCFVCLVLATGCAALRATTDEIRDEPGIYQSEAMQTASGLLQTFPEIPAGAGILIGYALSFFRRLYVNYKKLKAKNAERPA